MLLSLSFSSSLYSFLFVWVLVFLCVAHSLPSLFSSFPLSSFIFLLIFSPFLCFSSYLYFCLLYLLAFVPLCFILFPSISLYNMFSLSHSLFTALSPYHSLRTLLPLMSQLRHYLQLQTVPAHSMSSVTDVSVQLRRQAKLPACLFVFVFTSWWMDQS